ncbi:MAG: tRNA lysidine(34) synthetase TilS [Muribaculaceae bacterium]|nr:tRNA lysidine(34) synthetase TilS [Muribaculaceae bacterium]
MTGFIREFETRTREFIERHSLLRADAPVVVALSGGADSVALLAALHRLGYDCRAAHCNFHLRGEESMRDMRHCQQLCEDMGVDLYVRDFDVEGRRAATGESVEMACRELRYAWFADLLDREGAQAVAVGHHCEDRAETFMLNLMRGAGITGLVSMRPRSGDVVRPLLPFTRTEIERYLRDLDLDFIVDSSNAGNEYRRNRLRNIIFPALEEAFPGALESVLRTVANLEEAHGLYNEIVQSKRAEYFDGKVLQLGRLSSEVHALTLLFEFLRPSGFTFTQCSNILDAASSSGQRFVSPDGKVLAEVNHGVLEIRGADVLSQEEREEYPVNMSRDIIEPVRINVSRNPVENFCNERLGPSVAYFDAEALNGSPRWALRHWRKGDRIIPFGSRASKLVSDIFAGAKLSAAQKRAAWILTRNGEPVWIAGLRNSAAFPVGPGTKQYIRLHIILTDINQD